MTKINEYAELEIYIDKKDDQGYPVKLTIGSIWFKLVLVPGSKI